MIKILYIIDKLEVAGAQKHLVEVIKGLNNDIFEASVCCLLYEGLLANELKSKNIPVFSLNIDRIYSLRGIKSLFKLKGFIKENKIDIVHTYMFSANIFGNLAAKLAKTPIIISSRRDTGFHREGKWHHRLAYKFAHALADKVTAVSEAVKKIVIEKEGTPSDKIITIYNGVDIEKFRVKNPKSRLKASLRIKEDEFVVGMIANFGWIKGHKDFIEAAKCVLKSIPNAKFLLIGNGYLKADLQAIVRDQKLCDKIQFLGSREDIPELLSIMDISVNSSYSEGMSNTLLESMAAGVPVVATDVDGNREIIVNISTGQGNGCCGILVPPKDASLMAEAIIKILKNKDLAKIMGENSKANIEKRFTLRNMLEEIEKLYLGLAETKGIK